jgi:sporulation protein YlmC with PRC-barrel domain
MAEVRFTIGADVSCTDGVCGEVRRVVVDPVARRLTHLVVEPKRRHHFGRLVPLDLVNDTGSEMIRLRCTKAEFEKLDPAEETNFVAGSEHPGYEPDQVLSLPYFALGGGLGGGIGIAGVRTEGQGWDPEGSHGPRRRTITYDSLPKGEVQIRRGDHVYATDGEIGMVEGLVIDPADHQVTHVLLQEGHLWGRKEVAIPIGAVTGMETGVQLKSTKQEVGDLPPVEIDRLRG